MRWVAGDEVYGDATKLRDTIIDHGRLYVLAVRVNTPIWTERPEVEALAAQGRGRPRTKVRLAKGAPRATTVATALVAWPESRWERLSFEGEKGPRIYDWGRQRIVESRDGLPGPDGWLLARRSISDPLDIAYYLSNATEDIPLSTLAKVASFRYAVEQCIEEAKGETGLDAYQVRHWHSFHRHITLSMMAHAWLASIRHKANTKKGGPNPSWLN